MCVCHRVCSCRVGRYLSECRSGRFRHRLSGHQVFRLRLGGGHSDSQIFRSGHHTVDGADSTCSIVCRTLNTQSIIANLHQRDRQTRERENSFCTRCCKCKSGVCEGGSRKLLEWWWLFTRRSFFSVCLYTKCKAYGTLCYVLPFTAQSRSPHSWKKKSIATWVYTQGSVPRENTLDENKML